MLRILGFFAILIYPASACLWDRDTLAEEANGRAEAIRIIVGWFDRHPPRYYEIRLERVTAELLADPSKLNLYDDAAVACDRLGRHQEAIDWMHSKNAVLQTLSKSGTKEHRYRYLANLGTFYVHQWITKPQTERNADLLLLRKGEDFISQAIKENPDAHFGREVYQLLAIRWLLWNGSDEIDYFDDIAFTHGKDQWVETHLVVPHESEIGFAHIEGVSGLIQLGAAWQSLDAFHSLTNLLESNELASLAQLSFERESELDQLGARSIHPNPDVREMIVPYPTRHLVNPSRDLVKEFYPLARESAKNRNSSWIAYQNDRFDKAMHPDTHPDFWIDWVEPPFPEYPTPSIWARIKHDYEFRTRVFTGAVAGVIVLLILMTLRHFKIRHRRAPLS